MEDLALYDTDICIGAIHQCPGCNFLVTDREYHEHRAGCASLRGNNATKTHNSVASAVAAPVRCDVRLRTEIKGFVLVCYQLTTEEVFGEEL